MNWEMLTAIAAVLTLLLAVCGMIFVGGKLTQKVSDNSDDIKDLAITQKAQAEVIGTHETSLARLHEWKDGFNAGSRSAAPGTLVVR